MVPALRQLIEPLNLVPRDAPANRYHHQAGGSEVQTARELLALMATDLTIISMCDLSSWATSSIISGGTLHWRYMHNHPWGRTFNIIVGDGFFDRITFWNTRLLVDLWHIGAGHLVALRLPENRLRDGEFMEAFLSFLTSRKWMLSFGSPNQLHLTIRSNR